MTGRIWRIIAILRHVEIERHVFGYDYFDARENFINNYPYHKIISIVVED